MTYKYKWNTQQTNTDKWKKLNMVPILCIPISKVQIIDWNLEQDSVVLPDYNHATTASEHKHFHVS